MTARFTDRLTGRVGAPGPQDLPGRWAVAADAATLNGAIVEGSVVLGRDLDAPRWVLRSGHGTTESGTLTEDGDPTRTGGAAIEGRRQTAVDAVVDTAALLEEGAAWAAALTTGPFDPKLGSRVQQTELEKTLVNVPSCLRGLRDVAAQPREALLQLEVRLPTHTVRRPAPRAIDDLLHRPELWESVDANGVRPRRLLALDPAETYDLYENRVAYHAGVRLVFRLRERQKELKGVQEDLSNSFDLRGLSGEDLSWRLRNRVADLAGLGGRGAGLEIGMLTETAAQTRETVERLLGEAERVRRLPLFHERPGGVDRRAHVPMALRPTQLLTHEARYRRVGDLWRVLMKDRPRALSRVQYADVQRGYWAAFDRYVRWLVGHALANLGFRPAEGPFDEPATFSGPRGAVRLDAHAGVVVLTLAGSDAPMRVVPLALELTEGVRERLHAVVRDHRFTTVVGLPPPDGRQGRAAYTNGAPPWCPVLAVSPADPWSVERVARLVQGWLTHEVFARYVGPRSSPEVRRAIAVCPVCGVEGGAVEGRTEHNQLTFRAVCRDGGCRSSWELRTTAGGTRYPIVQAGQLRPEVIGDGDDWIEGALGRDVVAFPVRRPGGAVGFRAPS